MGGTIATLIFLGLMLICIALLQLPGFGAAGAPAVLVGLGLGAEVDLLAFLYSRRFGWRSLAEGHGALIGVLP